MLNVFEISKMVRLSGPGIRTLVHMKGCPLRCMWCSTPESQSAEDELGYNPNRCIGCGRCEQTCDKKAVHIENGKAVLTREKCNRCMACVDNCCTGSLKRYICQWEAADLAEELLKDKAFFIRSGGGVTISGGEPLAAPEKDLRELAARLKTEPITVGIDTTGYVPWSAIENIVPFADFFLWDLKHMDSIQHRKITGVNNERILENLKKLDDYGKDIYIRVPLIPGMNCTEENIRATCEFIKPLKSVKEIHLLPYHTLGKKRYEYCGKKYRMPEMDEMTGEEAGYYLKIAESFGLKAKIVG